MGGRLAAATDWLRRHRWFGLVVVLPIVLASIYYGLIASDIYVSESRFIIKSPGQKQSQMPGLANLFEGSGLTSGQEQTNEVMDYIRSRNALADLQHRIDVRARFESAQADYLSRFPQPFDADRFESLFKYYNGMVTAGLDSETQIAVLEVRAFSPADARDINAGLLDLSEGFVNRLNDRAQHKAIAENEQRVVDAEDRVREARLALARYRNRQGLFDPAKQAAAVLDVSSHLVADQAALQSQLDVMAAVTPLNPSIPALRSHIAAIGHVIDAQNGRAVGTSSGIASKLAGYDKLNLEEEFAANILTSASAALDQSRLDAQKQQFYLERVVEPNSPDLALLPHRAWRILTVAVAALGIYFVGWMLIVGILEHAPEN